MIVPTTRHEVFCGYGAPYAGAYLGGGAWSVDERCIATNCGFVWKKIPTRSRISPDFVFGAAWRRIKESLMSVKLFDRLWTKIIGRDAFAKAVLRKKLQLFNSWKSQFDRKKAKKLLAMCSMMD